jgi:nitrite reductase/ring-hydroxylating ferredoxin subunit
MAAFQTICTIDEIPEGEARAFSIGDVRVGLFRIGGEYYALEDGCPHAGASLSLGAIEGDVVRCRIHHWGFCLRDGAYVDEDKPCFAARSFPVRIADGEVQVCVTGEA